MDYVLWPGLTAGIAAFALAVQTAPVWFAAKIVGAGRAEFLNVCAASLIAGVICLGLSFALGGWGLVLVPFVFWVTFKIALDTTYLGAFILCVLGISFQVAIGQALKHLPGL